MPTPTVSPATTSCSCLAIPSQITLTNPAAYDSLQNFISSQKCLAASRGAMLERNSCRNPWQNYFNLRVGWTTPQVKGSGIELTLDIFNFLQLPEQQLGVVQGSERVRGGAGIPERRRLRRRPTTGRSTGSRSRRWWSGRSTASASRAGRCSSAPSGGSASTSGPGPQEQDHCGDTEHRVRQPCGEPRA